MFLNLELEQANNGHTDEYVAGELGITVQDYRARKETGEFVFVEIVALLRMYGRSFEHLFRRET
ncbi:MAG: hypothetical protein FWB85_05830 [Chitinispirillia bacterium]|nr:hypothetical protein [Chitinispirillia bacterium]